MFTDLCETETCDRYQTLIYHNLQDLDSTLSEKCRALQPNSREVTNNAQAGGYPFVAHVMSMYIKGRRIFIRSVRNVDVYKKQLPSKMKQTLPGLLQVKQRNARSFASDIEATDSFAAR